MITDSVARGQTSIGTSAKRCLNAETLYHTIKSILEYICHLLGSWGGFGSGAPSLFGDCGWAGGVGSVLDGGSSGGESASGEIS